MTTLADHEPVARRSGADAPDRPSVARRAAALAEGDRRSAGRWCSSTRRSRSCRSGRRRVRTMPVPPRAIVVLGAAQYNGRPSPCSEPARPRARLYRSRRRAAHRGHRRPASRRPLHRGDGRLQWLRRPRACPTGHPQGGARPDDVGVARARWPASSQRKGLTNVVLVSDRYHAKRIGQVAAEVGPACPVSPGAAGSGPASTSLLRETARSRSAGSSATAGSTTSTARSRRRRSSRALGMSRSNC